MSAETDIRFRRSVGGVAYEILAQMTRLPTDLFILDSDVFRS